MHELPVSAGWRKTFLCTSIALMLSGLSPYASAQAPSTQAQAQAAQPTFAIRGFNVKGTNPLSQSETTKILAPFLRNDATIDVLQKATSALEAAMREAGFGLHKVSLPPQEVGDTVTLEIVKFTIGRITVDGNQHFSEANVRASVPELKEGSSPNFKTLAIQTAIANQNPAKQLTVALKESDTPDTIDAALQLKETRPWTLFVNWANTGDEATGKDRLTLAGGHYNLWGLDHQLVAAYTTSVDRPSDVRQFGLSYRAPVYGLSGVLGVSYTYSDVLGNFGAFTSTGVGRTAAINYTYHLPHQGGQRSYLSVSLDDKLFEAAQISGFTIGENRRSRPLTVGYNSRTSSDSEASGYGVEASINTGTGSSNGLTAYRSEYSGITSRAFRILRANASYSRALPKNWLYDFRVQGQLSSTALISGEQFGLGGSSSVRGTGERLIAGDRGVQTNLELTTPELAKGLRLLGFLDAGWIGSRPNGGTRLDDDRLASVGLGLRFTHPAGVAFSADYGQIIAGSRVPLTLNSSAPKRGDDKLHVNLSVRF
jgi:hemolysin activation/secretion protein